MRKQLVTEYTETGFRNILLRLDPSRYLWPGGVSRTGAEDVGAFVA